MRFSQILHNLREFFFRRLQPLVDHPRDDQNKEYLVVTASHAMEASGYESGQAGAGGGGGREEVRGGVGGQVKGASIGEGGDERVPVVGVDGFEVVGDELRDSSAS
mgnify:CR=1 FL=1